VQYTVVSVHIAQEVPSTHIPHPASQAVHPVPVTVVGKPAESTKYLPAAHILQVLPIVPEQLVHPGTEASQPEHLLSADLYQDIAQLVQSVISAVHAPQLPIVQAAQL